MKTPKKIAWNGIQLSVPSTWELARVDARHLTFVNYGHPSMEIKWRTLKGRFSHRSQLKKLNAGHKAHPSKEISKWQLPPTWEQALASYSRQGFSWQSGPNSGHGATLYCPVCHKAIMFQIFEVKNRLTDPGLLHILKSLSDHREDECTAWKVFDIQALVPKSFRLNHYHFKPGNHELAFIDRSTAVRFHRWAPGTALLAGTSLSTFAADTLALSTERPRPTSVQGFPAVEWRNQGVTGWRSRFYRLRTKPALKWVMVWHIKRNNRILGISLESKKPFKPGQMAQLSDNFHLNLS